MDITFIFKTWVTIITDVIDCVKSINLNFLSDKVIFQIHLENHNGKANSADKKCFNLYICQCSGKHTKKSSGSSAGGGGSYLPMRKCSIPVQAIITPIQFKSKLIRYVASKIVPS